MGGDVLERCGRSSDDSELTGQAFGTASTKIGFDPKGGVYLIGRTGRKVALLHSADGGKTFSAYSIPGREESSRSFDIEQFSGHNGSDGPPPIVRFTRTAADPKRIWRRINDLELFVPERQGDEIVIGEPILLTKSCIGLSTHSGVPSSIVSRGSKVHVTWAEATDPEDNVPGVPTYVVSYDRRDQDPRQARPGRLRRPAERHPQHAQHHHGQSAGISMSWPAHTDDLSSMPGR